VTKRRNFYEEIRKEELISKITNEAGACILMGPKPLVDGPQSKLDPLMKNVTSCKKLLKSLGWIKNMSHISRWQEV
jgi:hypothetical protein